MTGSQATIILPIAALVLAALGVLGLWYWWTATSDGQQEGDRYQDQPPPEDPPAAEPPSDAAPQSDGFLSRLFDSLRPVPTPPPMPEGVPRPAAPPPAPPAADVAPAASPAPARPLGQVSDSVEVMRILRDLADGSLLVEVEGRRYRSLAEIHDPEARRRFVGNVRALSELVDVSDDFDLPTYLEASPPPPPDSRITFPPTDTTPPPPPPVPSSSGLMGGLLRRVNPGDSEEADEPVPFAEQIEALLQHHLTGHPELAARSIHIRSAADGGVRIEIDGHSYHGVDEVPDDAVREFIQATIREWEARQ